jgi:hypothetical protein
MTLAYARGSLEEPFPSPSQAQLVEVATQRDCVVSNKIMASLILYRAGRLKRLAAWIDVDSLSVLPSLAHIRTFPEMIWTT